MTEKKMTLEERLLNPQWVHGPDMNSDAVLDKQPALDAMKEAAAEIRRLTIDRDAWRLTAKTFSRALENVEKTAWLEGDGEAPAYQKYLIKCRIIARDALACPDK